MNFFIASLVLFLISAYYYSQMRNYKFKYEEIKKRFEKQTKEYQTLQLWYKSFQELDTKDIKSKH